MNIKVENTPLALLSPYQIRRCRFRVSLSSKVLIHSLYNMGSMPRAF